MKVMISRFFFGTFHFSSEIVETFSVGFLKPLFCIGNSGTLKRHFGISCGLVECSTTT